VQFIMAGSAVPRVFLPKMIEWYKQGRFPVERLVTTFPFSEINAAVHATESGEAIKPVVLMPDLSCPDGGRPEGRPPRRPSAISAGRDVSFMHRGMEDSAYA
jgi:hypothetical protein